MDAMTTGNAWFGVQGSDGTEAYTRNGSLEIDSEGTLKTNTGLTILNDTGTPIVAPPGSELTLGSDGTVTAKTADPEPIVIGRIKLATPDAEDPLKRGDDGLFRTTSGEPMPNDTNARLQVGVIEGSNVNAIETMVGMIQTARQFEAQTRLMQTAEQDDRSAAQLLSMQG
jgi:flagellar basal-body rod protein FlgF